MQITALRPISKISSNAVQNSCRLFSFKFEMTPATRLAADQVEETKSPLPDESSPKTNNFRYNVCQPRTSPIDRSTPAGDMTSVQRQSVKAAIEEQQLQPSMLPEYFQKHMEKHALVHPNVDPEEARIYSGHPINQRRFQVSKTYANAILPLKSVKLANPFPEPVKMMMSRTVSDDEKAEQMLAESKSQKAHSEWINMNKSSSFRNFSTDVRRWYSSSKTVGRDPEKCKTEKRKTEKGGCPRISLKGCPPRARVRCDRIAQHSDCKKQMAPYPAYSEFCHEDLDEKPSECKLCPWKSEENPNFKPQKKKLHISAPAMVKRSGLEMYFTEEESAAPIAEDQTPEGMLCDLRKPECARPKSRRCPPAKGEKKQKKGQEKKKKPKKTSSEVTEGEKMILSPADMAQNLLILRKHKKPPAEGPCKVKKFKFPPCTDERKTDSVKEKRCPVKKKKSRIRDCPRDKTTCEGIEGPIEGYRLEDDKMDKRKCPNIDLTVYRDEMDPLEERCRKKKKIHSKICPGDLLKKKRRKPKDKNASEVITPVDSPAEQPQPSRTI